MIADNEKKYKKIKKKFGIKKKGRNFAKETTKSKQYENI